MSVGYSSSPDQTPLRMMRAARAMYGKQHPAAAAYAAAAAAAVTGHNFGGDTNGSVLATLATPVAGGGFHSVPTLLMSPSAQSLPLAPPSPALSGSGFTIADLVCREYLPSKDDCVAGGAYPDMDRKQQQQQIELELPFDEPDESQGTSDDADGSEGENTPSDASASASASDGEQNEEDEDAGDDEEAYEANADDVSGAAEDDAPRLVTWYRFGSTPFNVPPPPSPCTPSPHKSKRQRLGRNGRAASGLFVAPGANIFGHATGAAVGVDDKGEEEEEKGSGSSSSNGSDSKRPTQPDGEKAGGGRRGDGGARARAKTSDAMPTLSVERAARRPRHGSKADASATQAKVSKKQRRPQQNEEDIAARPHRCSMCGKRFKRRYTLSQHEKTHETYDNRPYVCPYPSCGRRFCQQSNMTQHARAHSAEKPYKCPEAGCGASYKQSNNLRQHMQSVHGKELRKRCRKAGCSAVFETREELEAHRLQAHGARASGEL